MKKKYWDGEKEVERELTQEELDQADIDKDNNIIAEAQQLVSNMRVERNKLLAETDYTQFQDSPLTPSKIEEFAVYRQSLRDLPANFPDGIEISWPIKPQGA